MKKVAEAFKMVEQAVANGNYTMVREAEQFCIENELFFMEDVDAIYIEDEVIRFAVDTF